MRFDRESVQRIPGEKIHAYRKTALTAAAGPFDPPVEVVTQEGEVLRSEEACYVAIDAKGFPYPIRASVFHETYEPA